VFNRDHVFLGAFFLSGWGWATALQGSDPIAFRKIENKVFFPGESLEYVVKYQVISAGHASLSIEKSAPIHGRTAWRIISRARTNKFFDALFKVRDTNESWMDAEGFFSHRFEQNLNEGHYNVRRWTDYDYAARKFSWTKIEKGSEQSGEGELLALVQDALSCLYYARTLALKEKETYAYEANSSGKNFTLRLVVGNREKVRVPAGTFECLKVQPILAAEGIFKHKGALTVWLTDDDKKIPVLLRSKVTFGAFDAELTKFSLGSPDGEPGAELPNSTPFLGDEN